MAENTPYDDAFKTVVHDCRSLLIPLVNEVFHEHFSSHANVSFSSNEYFINQQDGVQEKRISDTIFTITDTVSKKYHWECQSDPDCSILVRLFEYHTQSALDDAVMENGELTVSFPYSAVLYLRHPDSMSDTLRIHIRTPGGTVSYDTAVNLRSEGYITEFVKITLIDMTLKVARNFARNYENVKKEVKAVMGGHILDTEARRILNQGRAEGETKGKMQGRAEGRILEYIDIRREDGHTDDEIIHNIMRRFNLSEEIARSYVLGVTV